VNSPELLKKTIQAVYAKGSALEYEVVEASSLHRLLRYANEGLFERDRDNVCLLHGGGVPDAGRLLAELKYGSGDGYQISRYLAVKLVPGAHALHPRWKPR
jgi:hypothetical protein